MKTFIVIQAIGPSWEIYLTYLQSFNFLYFPNKSFIIKRANSVLNYKS